MISDVKAENTRVLNRMMVADTLNIDEIERSREKMVVIVMSKSQEEFQENMDFF